jgi:hypothetical protein
VRADGAFELKELPPGDHVLRVDLRDGSPHVGGPEVNVQAGKATDGIRVVVGAVGVIRGRVVDLRGDPEKSVCVAAIPALASKFVEGRSEEYATGAVTDTGEFELRGVREGLYRVGVASLYEHHLGEWLTLTSHVPSVEARPGDTNVQLVVPRAGRITGRVVLLGDAIPLIDLIGAHGPTEFGTLQLGDGFRGEVYQPGS